MTRYNPAGSLVSHEWAVMWMSTGCESRSLSDSRSKMLARAADDSSTFGRRRGPTSLRSHHGGRRAQTGPGSSTDATKTREPSRSWRRTRNSPRHPRDRGGQIRRLDTRPDHRRYGLTARHRQSSGGLHQHRQDPLIMPDLVRGSRSTAIRRNKRRGGSRAAAAASDHDAARLVFQGASVPIESVRPSMASPPPTESRW
jgi:hypothetical protein